MALLFKCLTVCPVCVWHPLKPEEITSSRSGITDGDELPKGARNLNLCLLEEYMLLLAMKPSLQP